MSDADLPKEHYAPAIARRIVRRFGHDAPFPTPLHRILMIPTTKLLVLPLLCVSASLLAHGSLAAQGEQTLRVNAKKGATIWLLQEQKSEQSIDQGGQQMEMGSTTTHTLHVSVLDVDDKGVMTVETEIVRIHGSMQMGPMGESEFDSAAPAGDDDDGDNPFGAGSMTKMLTKSAGKKFNAKVDGTGKVMSLEGAEELLKGGSGRMGNPLTEGALKQMVEGAFGILPEKPVAAGATWDHVQKDTGRMPAEQKMKLTLAKIDDASFEITAAGTIEKPPAKEGAEEDGDPMQAMLKNMTIQNGKITGTQRVSRQDGFIIDATNTMSMDVEMETPMAMSMTVKQTNTTKRTTAEAAMPKKAEKAAPAKEEKKDAPKEEKK